MAAKGAIWMVRDYGAEAQRAAEHHLAQLAELLDAEGDGEEVEWPESAGVYCGCDTCVVREVLWAAWPHLLAEAGSAHSEAPAPIGAGACGSG